MRKTSFLGLPIQSFISAHYLRSVHLVYPLFQLIRPISAPIPPGLSARYRPTSVTPDF
jgi:hypothetical protein